MINKINSDTNFGAKFDTYASQRLLDATKNCIGLRKGVEARISHIGDWGDKDSVILLKKDDLAERFVLKNDKFGNKEVPISRHVSDEKNSIFIAFFDITKKAINEAEKFFNSGY